MPLAVGSVYPPGPPVSCRYCVVGYLCPAVEWRVIFSEYCPLIDTVCSDASGCGAYTQSGSPVWLQAKWPPTWVEVSIAVKELLPIFGCSNVGAEMVAR